ncbi:MAG: GTPase [Candidatus Caenarcaniphilales bacterium]|nr:GTPase [Candidatus Caenarcaniphilales bacterium]
MHNEFMSDQTSNFLNIDNDPSANGTEEILSELSETQSAAPKRMSWYPGHIKAAKDELKSKWLPLVDVIVELVDGRIPLSGKTEELASMTSKPIIQIYTKKDLADTKAYLKLFSSAKDYLLIDGRKPHEWKKFFNALVKEKTLEIAEKLKQSGRKRNIRVGVCGLPNVGKSTFFNSLLPGKNKAKTSNNPGTTRQNYWIRSQDFDLLDSPGIIGQSVEMERAYKLALCNLLPQKLFETDLLLERLVELFEENGYATAKRAVEEKISNCSSEEIIKRFQDGNFGKICLDKI